MRSFSQQYLYSMSLYLYLYLTSYFTFSLNDSVSGNNTAVISSSHQTALLHHQSSWQTAVRLCILSLSLPSLSPAVLETAGSGSKLDWSWALNRQRSDFDILQMLLLKATSEAEHQLSTKLKRLTVALCYYWDLNSQYYISSHIICFSLSEV